jgi:diguanylate cyclase (GGDEF)-like protein/PAS domain S-box-containing protein
MMMPLAPAMSSQFDARALLDCVEDVIVVVDENFHFTYANHAARAFLGPDIIATADHGGSVSLDVVHPDDVEHVIERFAEIAGDDDGRGALRMRVREGDGWRPVEAILTNRRDMPGINGVVACFRNLTQEERLRSNLEIQLQLDLHNRALRNELQERQRFLSRLVRIQSSIARRAPLDDVLVAIVDGAAQLLGDIVVGLRLRDPFDPSRLVLVASHGIDDDLLAQLSECDDVGIGNQAYRENCSIVVDNYADLKDPIPAFVTHGLRAAMAVPVRSDGVAVGSLAIGTMWSQTYSDTEREMLEILAEHAGIAILDANSREIVRIALMDSLTGLPNRRLFLERLTQAIELCQHNRRPLAVLFIDLDGFKAVNDGRGHAAGDEVLIEIAKRIEKTIDSPDSAARLGGDEFVVMLEDCDLSRAATTADAISTAIRAPLRFGRRSFYVGATIGVATIDGEYVDAEGMLRQADIAMYRGKRDGRNKVVIFEPSMERAVIARAELEGELRGGIRSGGIHAVFQPVVDLQTGAVMSVEALARWTSVTQGPIAPTRFVELAEQMNMVAELDHAMIKSSCRAIRDIVDPISKRPVGLSVNLSPQYLDQIDVVDELLDVLRAEDFPPTRLIVEVTETEAMRDPVAVGIRIRQLREHGIRVAIDDFGTGYSSLAYLEQFPIDYVKIDQRFVEQIEDSARTRSLVESMSQMVHSLNLTAVAEGVETLEQAQTLRAMGFELAQGYFFARPIPADELMAAINDVPRVVGEWAAVID